MHKTLLFFFCFSFFSSPLSVNAQKRNKKGTTIEETTQTMTPEMLWDIRRLHFQYSLNDETGVVTISDYNLKGNRSETNIYLLNYADGSLDQLTDFKGDVSHVSPTPRDNYIGFLYKGQWHELNMKSRYHIRLQNFSEDIGLFSYAPNGRHAVYAKAAERKEFETGVYEDMPKANVRVYDALNYRHWDSWNDHSRSQLYVESYSSGRLFGEVQKPLKNEPYEVPTKPFGGFEDLAWAPNGNEFVYVCKKVPGTEYAKSTNTDLFLYDLKSRKTKCLTKENLGYDRNPKYSEDGKYLGYLQMKTPGFESDKQDIMLYSFRKKRAFNLTTFFDGTVSDFLWVDDNRMVFSSPHQGGEHIFQVDFTTSLNRPTIRQITKGDFNFHLKEYRNGKILATREDFNHAPELFSIDWDGNTKQLSHLNDAFYANIEPSEVEKKWIETSDGHSMLTYIIYPPNYDKFRRYPALLYCQGGPQAQVSQFYSYRWNFQVMAAQGYIVIAPNRRGLPGFGREWNDAISKDWGGKAMQDYLDAVDEVKKDPLIHEDRIAAVGASYGGYSVYMLAGIHNNRFKSFIAHCGLFNLESWYGSTEELFFANWDIGGPYWEANMKEAYDKNSPHNYVQNWDTPMLIFHGAKDFRVPDTQGLEAFQAAQLRGLRSRLIHFPEENHWVSQPQNSIVWQREYFKWLKETL